MADPRAVALEVLTRVRTEGAYVNLLLPVALRRAGLTGRDAAFVTELVSGTVRRQLSYDAIIDSLVSKRPQPKVRDVLRLGAHQLLAMRVPTHAAVSTSVDLVGKGPAGFVNAILRKIAARDLESWLAELAPADGTTANLAVRHSHPRWVVEELAAALVAGGAAGGTAGPEVGPAGGAELESLLEADNAAPKVTLVARPGLAEVAELGGTPTGLSPYAAVLEAGDPGAIAAVREGRAGVQDEGSQLIAIALAQTPLAGRDERWLDLCAGPGGKAALLAALADERGAVLLANERQPHRAGLVRSAVRALRNAQVVAGDGTRPAWQAGSFDRVLVDAPCSGLGALRRRPESRWRRQPDDLPGLVELQTALLRSALRSVRPGGVVLYATCSPVLAETADVVSAVLAADPTVVLEDAGPLFATVADTGPLPGTVQLWPHRHGTDAMFAALLRREPGPANA